MHILSSIKLVLDTYDYREYKGPGRRQTSQKPGCEKNAPSTAAFSAAAFVGEVAGVVAGVESLRAMEGDAGWAQ